MKAEIVLDIACVWSYLAHSRFRQAAARHRGLIGPLEVTYRPFLVAPEASFAGEPLTEVHHRVFGAAAADNEAKLEKVAKSEGLALHFDRVVFVNTKRAHLLVAHAADQGRAEEVVAALFNAYFAESRNVADPKILVELAVKQGVHVTSDDLTSDAAAGRIERALADVRAEGVTGVPVFAFNGQSSLPGYLST